MLSSKLSQWILYWFSPFPFESLRWIDLVYGFFLFAFIGWAGECVYAYYVHRRRINRGFLTGPWCPIYGAGAMAASVILMPVQGHLDTFGIFLFGGIICTILEYVTGAMMEKIWHMRWWDYSEHKFNLKGYVCLSASLVWGVLCVLLLKVIDPLIFRLFHKIPSPVYLPISLALCAAFLFDLVWTLIASAKLSRNVKTLGELATQLKDETLANYEESAERWKKISEDFQRKRSHRRLMNAFPSLRQSDLTQRVSEAREWVADLIASLQENFSSSEENPAASEDSPSSEG